MQSAATEPAPILSHANLHPTCTVAHMTLLEAKRRVLLAFSFGLACQFIILGLITVGLLVTLVESAYQSSAPFNALSMALANFASRILSVWPGALHLAPIAPRYYPGQLDGNLAFALSILAFAGATAIRNWGAHLQRDVKAAERQIRSRSWQHGHNSSSTSVNVSHNWGSISIASPPAKDWSSRPLGIVLLAIVAGLAVEMLARVLA